jgi:hypothetical protein
MFRRRELICPPELLGPAHSEPMRWNVTKSFALGALIYAGMYFVLYAAWYSAAAGLNKGVGIGIVLLIFGAGIIGPMWDLISWRRRVSAERAARVWRFPSTESPPASAQTTQLPPT